MFDATAKVLVTVYRGSVLLYHRPPEVQLFAPRGCPCAWEMADATRPTPWSHARTPLTRGSVRGAQPLAVSACADMVTSSSFSNYHPSTHEERRETASSLHAAVLMLAGGLLAWVRPWDAKAAPRCACSNLVGCTKAMVLLNDGRCVLFGELSAAELMLERLRHVTPSLVGHAERGWTFCEWRCDARGGTQTN